MIRHWVYIAVVIFICGNALEAKAIELSADSLLALTKGEIVSISGQVLCRETNEAMVNAHIYEDGYLIAITNNAGEFSFEAVKEKFELSVSYVGYETYTINVLSEDASFLEIKMKERKLKEAVVRADENGFVQLEPRAVEDFTVYAGKKADLISTDAQLSDGGTNNPRQTFSRIAGLNIWQADAGGLQLAIGSRGLDPNRTAHFNVRQNGSDISAEPLGYPEAYYTPAFQAVDRIEIIRGAASLQYGPQFGGMLNFRMKKGNTKKKIAAVGEYTRGSFNLNNYFGSVGGQLKNLNYYLSANVKNSDGYAENSEFSQNSFYGGLTYKFSEKSSIEVTGSYMNYLSQQAGGLTDAQFEEDPFQSLRERNWFSVDWFTSNLRWNYKLGDNTELESKFFYLDASRSSIGFLQSPNRNDLGEARNIIHGEFNNVGNETRVKRLHSVLGHTATFITGIRAFYGTTLAQQKEGDTGSGFISDLSDGNYPIQSDYKYHNENYSAFIEEVIFLKKWKVTPGARMEYIRTGFDGRYVITQRDGAGNILPGYPVTEFSDGSNTRPIFLYGIGVERSLSKTTSLLLNLTKNYRPVNFSDLFIARPAQAVDPNIQDEQGHSVDLEFKGIAKNVLKWSVDFYALQYEDKIGSILTTQQDPILGNRVVRLRTNVNNGLSYGVDMNFELDLMTAIGSKNEKWQVLPFGSFSLNRSEYRGSESQFAAITDGNQIEKAPQIQGKCGFRITRKDLSFEALYTYVGEQFSDATNSEFDPRAIVGLIPSYHVVDLSAKYEFKKFYLNVNLNNATNSIYFARRAAAYPGPGIIAAAPRTFGVSLGVRI
ncbi:MAG: carboxypeptidase-like regulatory domain-containing protein [Flavobacteriales bacterium]